MNEIARAMRPKRSEESRRRRQRRHFRVKWGIVLRRRNQSDAPTAKAASSRSDVQAEAVGVNRRGG